MYPSGSTPCVHFPDGISYIRHDKYPSGIVHVLIGHNKEVIHEDYTSEVFYC